MYWRFVWACSHVCRYSCWHDFVEVRQRTILGGGLQMLSAWIVGLRSLLTRNYQVSPWDRPISAAPVLELQTQDDVVLGQCLSVLLISWYKTLFIGKTGLELTGVCFWPLQYWNYKCVPRG